MPEALGTFTAAPAHPASFPGWSQVEQPLLAPSAGQALVLPQDEAPLRPGSQGCPPGLGPVSYTHLRAHETSAHL
eukprot:2517728-Alexandrium_andersonii.AAC.1